LPPEHTEEPAGVGKIVDCSYAANAVRRFWPNKEHGLAVTEIVDDSV